MFAPFPRTKRQRSPSPPLPDEYVDLASPLDILIKRRRREAVFNTDGYPFPDSHPQPQPYGQPSAASCALDPSAQAESSTAWLARPAVNGRRSRQWQHLNAPPPSAVSGGSAAEQALPSASQPAPSNHKGYGASPHSIEYGRAHSQPDLPFHRHFMSSSPIRHQPPGSSPFRSSAEARVAGVAAEDADPRNEADWGEDELGREWGEYARENSVLHSLHRARANTFVTPPNPHNYSTMTPARPQTQYPQQTPLNPQYQPTPYRDHPPSSGSTQYPMSSPFPGAAASDTTQLDYDYTDVDDGGDTGMEELEDGQMTPQEEETRRRYEDANRLLAELAVARRQRWGDDG